MENLNKFTITDQFLIRAITEKLYFESLLSDRARSKAKKAMKEPFDIEDMSDEIIEGVNFLKKELYDL